METETERNYILNVSDLHSVEREIQIDAGPEECAAIAGRFGILRIESFNALCTAALWRRKGVCLKGRIRAQLEQSCVITLEPVPEDIDIPFKAFFWPAQHAGELPDPGLSGEVFSDILSDDSPELFENDEINAGEAVLEYFALAIDPYPKKPDASTVQDREKPEEKASAPSPFLVLKGLKNGGE